MHTVSLPSVEKHLSVFLDDGMVSAVIYLVSVSAVLTVVPFALC
jgi:hypothetical protein